MKKYPRLFSVYLVKFGRTVGAEIRKTRPCVVTSPDKNNAVKGTVMVAPMTTGGRNRQDPFRVRTRFNGRNGHIVLEQTLTVDKSRLIKYLGDLSEDEQQRLTIASREYNL